MLNRLIEASLRRPFVVIVALVLVVLGGLAAVRDTRLDAIPDLTDTQVIVVTEFPGQGPQVIEDQVTYPLTSSLLAVPGAATVRGYSYFGISFAYVLFDEGTDLYWARSRVLESLSSLADVLPDGVTPRLGPDATGVGWALMYVLESPSHGLDELRSVQDFYLRYALSSVEGVAEVASFGGFERELHVEVDPLALRAHGVTLDQIEGAIRASNDAIGGRLIEQGERELMVRSRGYLAGDPDTAIDELRRIALGSAARGTPITLGDVAHVTLGPGPRRGIADWNGEGETVGGIVVVRADADTRATLDRVKAKLAEADAGLPDGVSVIIGYDRSGLIERSIKTLSKTLVEESIIVALVCLLFLFHVRSALVAIVSIPVSILIAFLILRAQGLGLNIMSLGGIAISIGVLVDAAVVMVENAHKHLEAAQAGNASGPAGSTAGDLQNSLRSDKLRSSSSDPAGVRQSGEGPPEESDEDTHSQSTRTLDSERGSRVLGSKERFDVILAATREVGPTLFFTLLVITVSFLPVFALEAEEGKLFRPLAFTKTWSMAAAALVAVTLMPVLTLTFVRGRIRGEGAHPISRVLRAAYRPALRFAIRRRWVVLTAAALLVASIAIPLGRLGNELMPPLWEGDLLYMPTTFPGLSATEAKEILQATDRAIAEVPEVVSVLGKVGRAETATDPAPLSMLETTVQLRDPSEWRPGVTREALIAELDAKTKLPGLTNAWTQPIRTRIDMLSTGIRTPVGIKIAGPDLAVLETLSNEIGALVETLPGTSSAYADRVMGGLYLDIDVDRDAVARHGLRVGDVQAVIATAIGGTVVSTVVDGRERTPIRVRYPRELRDDPETLLREVTVPSPLGGELPLGRLATARIVDGPPMIKSENARPNAWVYVDLRSDDLRSWVERARAEVAERIDLPEGYSIAWSGRWEAMERVRQRLATIVPVTLLLIAVILYGATRSAVKTGLIFLTVPMSLVGAFWLVDLLGYQMSVAVWVGLIALAGLDAEMGVVMLLYLDLAYEKWRADGRMSRLSHLAEAVEYGAVQRIRPKLMTVTTTFCGLVPILWATGSGSDVMRRIAAPMVGGVVTSFVGELLVFPALYFVWRGRELRAARTDNASEIADSTTETTQEDSP